MDEIAADVQRQVAADGAWRSVERIGRADAVAHHLHRAGPFDTRDHDRRAGDVLQQAGVEALALVFGVVADRQLLRNLDEFEPDDLQPTRFQTGQNGPDEASLHAIWLDDDQRAFDRHMPEAYKKASKWGFPVAALRLKAYSLSMRPFSSAVWLGPTNTTDWSQPWLLATA